MSNPSPKPMRWTAGGHKGAAWRRGVDRVAGWTIRAAGLAVILVLMAMLLLIGLEALPLFLPAGSRVFGAATLPEGAAATEVAALSVDADLHQTRAGAALVLRDGRAGFLAAGASTEWTELPESADASGNRRVLLHAEPHAADRFSLLWSDGDLTLTRARFRFPASNEDEADGMGRFETVAHDPDGADGEKPLFGLMRGSADRYAAIRIYADGRIREKRLVPGPGLMGRKKPVAAERVTLPSHRVEALSVAMDAEARRLYLGTRDGTVVSVAFPEDLSEPATVETVPVSREGAAIGALTLLQGDYALAVGDTSGGTGIWFPRREGGAWRLRRSHHWPGDGKGGAAVAEFFPCLRNRSFVTRYGDGSLRWRSSTTGAELLSVPPGRGDAAAIRMAQNARGDLFASLDARGEVTFRKVDNKHPEAGWSGFFGRLWYEGYDRPGWVWQSTAGGDGEPKLSLMPLIWGTLKGALYAMAFAVPLSLAAAVYVSQLAAPMWRGKIKPVVEMLAAVPSVVVGFVAALWLAPLLETHLLFPLLFAALLPAFGAAGLAIRRRFRGSKTLAAVESHHAFLAILPLVALAALAAYWLRTPIEGWCFGGDFRAWLAGLATQPGREWLHYDQRNAIIIAVAMGFAVCPTVFSLAEDALSAVPASLSAASLALGASKWQTVWRVVLPTASPGMFTAVMLGFGRAAGETMIVLMATGNTPLMSLSPFNGMRTLSANIAVEMPEAPVGGTLYLTLFLCALILFLVTFLVNAVAEVVRRRLRRRYGA